MKNITSYVQREQTRIFKKILIIIYSKYFRDETYLKFGIRLAFVATRSGLLRFNDHADLFAERDEKRRQESGREEEQIKEP